SFAAGLSQKPAKLVLTSRLKAKFFEIRLQYRSLRLLERTGQVEEDGNPLLNDLWIRWGGIQVHCCPISVGISRLSYEKARRRQIAPGCRSRCRFELMQGEIPPSPAGFRAAR